MSSLDTIAQIDEALHAIRARLRTLEGRSGGSGGASSTMRLSDETPRPNSGAGDPGEANAAARGDHVHPAVQWTDILGKPLIEGSDKTFRHVQIVAVDTWVITHNLGKYPTVAVVDTSGAVMIGELHYNTLSRVTITFSAAVSGEAYCN